MAETSGHANDEHISIPVPTSRHNATRRSSSSSHVSRLLSRNKSGSNEPNGPEIHTTLSHQSLRKDPEKNLDIFRLVEGSTNPQHTAYDLDVVAVHSYGDDLNNAWRAWVPTAPLQPDVRSTTEPPIPRSSSKRQLWKEFFDVLNNPNNSAPESQPPQNMRSPVAKINWLINEGFLPNKIKTARVLFYEYHRPRDENKPPPIDIVTQELAKHLVDARQTTSERPIIFVGHDFGITIIEKTLMDCKTAADSSIALCMSAAAIIYLASPGSDLKAASEPNYFFTLNRDRRLGLDDSRSPYLETRNSHFLSQHVEKFKQFAEWLKIERSGITLKAFVSDGKFSTNADPVYCAIVDIFCNVQKLYPFLLAASEGDHELVKAYLKTGRDPDILNDSGQSALHLAVQRNHMQVIRVLVEGFNADVTGADCDGQTPLHLTMMHCPENRELIELLSLRGANVNLRNKAGKSSFDLAKEFKVDPSALEKCFLFQGPSEEVPEEGIKKPFRPQSSEAVRACRHFQATIAEFHMLEKKEQHIRAQPTVDEILYMRAPDEILSAKRGKGMTSSPTCRWIHLPANNVAWVEDLFLRLNLRVDEITEDQHEGPTPWSHYMRPQSKLLRPLKFTKDKSDGKWTSVGVGGNNFVLFMPFLNYERACDSILVQKAVKEASRLDFKRRTTPEPVPVISFGPKSLRQTLRLSIPTGTGRLSPLPEERSPNNSIQGNVSSAATSPQSHTKSQTLLLGPNDKKLLAVDPDSLYRLDSEKSLINGYLYDADLKRDRSFLGPLHVRRTLDQSHYFMLEDTSERDQDQVVLRGARNQKETGEKRKAPSNILTETDSAASESDRETEVHPMVMVDQLWLWVIGDTVITSFPQKWSRHNDVLDLLLRYLRIDKERAPIRNVQDLVEIIMKFTIGVFNRPRTTLGLGLHDYFETAVGSVADREIRLFRKFEEDVKEDPTAPGDKGTVEEKLNAIYQIKEEIKLMRETKDIRDELRMILKVLNDQTLVMTDMATILESPEERTEPGSSHAHRGGFRKGFRQAVRKFVKAEPHSPHQVVTTFTDGDVEAPTRSDVLTVGEKDQHPIVAANVRDFNRMLSHTNASYEALNHLLDLKQKSANATEARFARKGAEESAKQGNTIMFFTIVTIIFGSLSFVTAFFALNVSAFPPGKGNNPTPWQLGHIVGYVAGISIGLAIPFVLVAFAINPILEFSEWRKRRHEGSMDRKAKRRAGG